MKKSLLIISLLAVVFSFSSCKKDGHVYNPGKRISRMYVDWGEGEGRMLHEVWNWGEDNLKSIDHYSYGSLSWTEDFSYNEEGMLTSVEDFRYGELTEYKYDGRFVTRASYYEDGTLYAEFTFKYNDDNKITSIDYYEYDYKKASCSHLLNDGNGIINSLISERTLSTIQKMASSASKDSDFVNIKLSWEEDNLSEVVMTQGSARIVIEYQYDDKINPFKNFFSLYTEDYIFDYCASQNNPIQIRSTETYDGKVSVDLEKNTYTYEDDYPSIRRMSFEGEGVAEIRYFEYE